MAQEYVTVKLPKQVTDEIDNAMEHEAKSMGYSSRADFVKDAVRDLLQKIKQRKEA